MRVSLQAGKAFAAAPHTDFVVEVAGRLAKTTFLEQVESNMVLAQSADLRLPHMWSPVTRLMKRKIVYHAGPTNSGTCDTDRSRRVLAVRIELTGGNVP